MQMHTILLGLVIVQNTMVTTNGSVSRDQAESTPQAVHLPVRKKLRELAVYILGGALVVVMNSVLIAGICHLPFAIGH